MPGRRKSKNPSAKGLLTCEIALLDDSSFQQVYKSNTLGQDVFDAVCRTLEVLEVEYFGLQYSTSAGVPAWLDLTKPVRKQAPVPRSGTLQLEFRVKFFVRNPNQLQDEYTRYLFALQLRRDIYTKRLPCSHEPAAKLLAVLVQGDLGDFDLAEHRDNYTTGIDLLPDQSVEVVRAAEAHHQSSWCRNLTPADCDFIFVDMARRLPLYGLERYPLDPAGTRGQQHFLACSYEGMSVLVFDERPNLFSWPCISRLSYRGKRLIMHLHKMPNVPVGFLFESKKLCKRFWRFAVEHHTFFRRVAPLGKGAHKKRDFFRTGSKYRFSGRTQSQIIREIRQRHDVVLRSQRSTSPSFKRYSMTRLSSAKRSLALDRHGPKTPASPSSKSTASQFEFVPAVTISLPSPSEHSQSKVESPVSSPSRTAVENAPSDQPPPQSITKTEVSTTRQEPTSEERQPVEVAPNGHVLVHQIRGSSSTSPVPPVDSDLTPMNMSPRDTAASTGALERTFSNQLREGQISDLSELVRRFSTPDFSSALPSTKSASPNDEEEIGLEVSRETGDRDDKSESELEQDDDRTPAVSADESCISPPESTLERRRTDNRNETRRVQQRASPSVRPTSRTSEISLSDSSDDNLSMSEERTIRALKRRLTRHSKKKPASKSFYISQELRDTERSYVADLDMLNVKFRNAIQTAGALSEEKTNELFEQLDDLYAFHIELLVELENRMAFWEGRSPDHDPTHYGYIGDIMAKRMSGMRIYTPYIMDQSRLLGLVQQWADENAKFRDLYNSFEAEQCHLPLLEFFNRPMQRMVHYKLLLGRLIKTYDPSHQDIENLKSAHQAVSDAADYTNRQCRIAENEKKLEELQRELSGIENLVKKGRYLVREGRLLKVGKNGPRQRHFLLFNDLLLYVTPRAIGLPQVKSTISLKDSRVEVCQDGNPYGENAFAFFTRNKSFFLIARSVRERDVWVEDINSSIEDTNGAPDSSRTPSVSDLGQINVSSNVSSLQSTENIVLSAPLLLPFEMYDECKRCRAEFTLTKRRHHCNGCGEVMCSTCLKHSAVLPFYGTVKKRRVCRDCYQKFQAFRRSDSKDLTETLASVSTSAAWKTKPGSNSYSSPTHSYASGSGHEDLRSFSIHARLSSDTTASRGSLVSDEGSMWSSDTASRTGSFRGGVRVSMPNGLDAYPGESLTELSEIPDEVQAGNTSPPPQADTPSPLAGEGSGAGAGGSGGARARAQTMDPHLVSAKKSMGMPFRGPSMSPLRRNTSLRYDTAKRMRQRNQGVLDDERMLSSVANHMSGHLLCKLHEVEGHPWKRYWVVCTSFSLFFYKTHHETKPLHTMALPDYEFSVVGPTDGALCELPHSFKLSNGSSASCFVSDSSHALDRWTEVITSCRAGPSRGSTYHIINA
eukprot:scpid15605/ scgid18209/ FERM, RhoGEF and pleckstrin domain-containing protein 2; FERM domain including RhoGEF